MAQNSTTFNSNHNQVERYENFAEFLGKWLLEQEQDLRELAAAVRAYNRAPHQAEQIQATKEVADRVLSHYEHYYKVKEESTPGFVYQMLSPSWRSTIEEAYMWIGGWRPTMVFHVLYSKTGLQFEARLIDLLHGIETHDLGLLSAVEVQNVDKLQLEIVDAERMITAKWAAYQGTVGDISMVTLSNAISESLVPEVLDEQLDDVLASKEVRFVELLKEADELRLTTLKRLVAILTPIQTLNFFISATQLHLQLHNWGKKKDVEQAEAQAQDQDQDQTVPPSPRHTRAGPSSGPSNP